MANEDNDSGVRGKAIWDAESISIFCDLCIVEVDAGNHPTTHFTKVRWDNLMASFTNKSGKVYSKAQLKNKWDALKNDWKLWKQLIGSETGLGWNDYKRTVDASEEWWRSKIEANPNLMKFLKEGISPEMEDKFDRMFMNTVATGAYALGNSSFGENDDTIDGSNIDHTQNESSDDSQESAFKEKKSTTLGPKANKFKKFRDKKSLGGASRLSNQIDRLIDVVKDRSDTTFIVRREMPRTSISEVMKLFRVYLE